MPNKNGTRFIRSHLQQSIDPMLPHSKIFTAERHNAVKSANIRSPSAKRIQYSNTNSNDSNMMTASIVSRVEHNYFCTIQRQSTSILFEQEDNDQQKTTTQHDPPPLSLNESTIQLIKQLHKLLQADNYSKHDDNDNKTNHDKENNCHRERSNSTPNSFHKMNSKQSQISQYSNTFRETLKKLMDMASLLGGGCQYDDLFDMYALSCQEEVSYVLNVVNDNDLFHQVVLDSPQPLSTKTDKSHGRTTRSPGYDEFCGKGTPPFRTASQNDSMDDTFIISSMMMGVTPPRLSLKVGQADDYGSPSMLDVRDLATKLTRLVKIDDGFFSTAGESSSSQDVDDDIKNPLAIMEAYKSMLAIASQLSRDDDDLPYRRL